jgi:hypothetical protein
MSISSTLTKSKASEVYHDIYDLSIFPVSLGDVITWGVKSALRASAAGRKKVHVHLVCDPEKSGFNPMQSGSYLVDLFAVEILPAFYSHPYFSGVSLHRSRADFLEAFAQIAETDEVSQEILRENEARFQERSDFDRTNHYFKLYCSQHEEINECYRRTGAYPKVGYLKDCLVDWQALQLQFPKETLWVTVQFRLRRLDRGMPVFSTTEWHRDAPFLTWYNFIRKAHQLYPTVRFVLLGRLQEKPLELLRLPNVVVLRTLGMNLGHEIAALLNSDLYIGSPSGFAQAAHFSDVPYDIFSCTEEGCGNYGIPYGTGQIPIATPRQRLHYETEETETLLATLEQALQQAPAKRERLGALEINHFRSTDRFFINDGESDAELSNILSTRLLAIALMVERGSYLEAKGKLDELRESFPRFTSLWTDLNWLNGVVDQLLPENGNGEPRREGRHELLADVSRYCHPERLVRKTGRFFDDLLISEGFRRDGWCEKKTKLVFAPSRKGDFLVLKIARLASGELIRLVVRINAEEPVPFVLVNDFSVLEIPVSGWCIPTEVNLEADRSFRINPREEKEFSYQIEAAGVVSKRTPKPAVFRGDKKDLREKIASGIYSNGAASNLVRIRIDNPFPEETDIMVRLEGTMPRLMRRRRHFRIRINQDEVHECIISGKHFTASVPCPGRPGHVSLLLQFWDADGSETEPKDNRAVIKSIEAVPATVKKAEVRSGWRSSLDRLLNDCRAKLSGKVSKRP